MKNLVLCSIAVLMLCGCGHLDLASQGDPSRVLVGTVDAGSLVTLPPGAVVVVRVVNAGEGSQAPQVLGSQTLDSPGALPVPFRVEYRAEDEVLRHGLNIEARVSVAGQVRYYNVNKYAVTLGNASSTHRVMVNATTP